MAVDGGGEVVKEEVMVGLLALTVALPAGLLALAGALPVEAITGPAKS